MFGGSSYLFNNGDVLLHGSNDEFGNRTQGFTDLALSRLMAQQKGQRQLQQDAFGEADRTRAFQGQQAQAGRDQDWRTLLQTQGFTQGENAATRAFQGSQQGLDRDLAWRSLLQGQDFQGGQNAADRQQNQRQFDASNTTAQRGQDLNLQAAQLPWQYKRDIFGQVFPLVQQAAGGFGQQGGQGALANFQSALQLVGGQNSALPGLPPSAVFTPEQTQQRVNAQAAQNEAAAATQRQRAAEDTAARGFGSRSPLLAALNAQIDTSTAAANSDFARQAGLDAAQANAQQGLQVGALANQQFQLANDADIRRRQAAGSYVQGNQQNALQLIAALAGLA